ncbi:efflux RND transporter periplasmic adaptor subunit [Vulgatibacter incomptus]|nr:efflux RND transporter periplasmic adaptor subunit [Vulgatibacter incomptus]
MNPRILAAVSIVAFAGCASKADPTEVLERPAISSARSPWVQARSPEGLSLLEAPATVVGAAESEAALAVPFAARIDTVRVRIGDKVAKGAPLLDVVMPEVVGAAGRLAAARVRIDVHGQRKARLEALKEHGLVRLADLAEVEAALGEAKAERLVARAILAGAGIGENEAGRLLSGSGTVPLRSPVAGVVVAIDAPLGSVREAGGVPLVRVAGEAGGRVVARMSGPIPDGAALSFVAGSGEPVPLTPISTSPRIDPRDGTRELFLEPDRPLPSGTAGVLRISTPPELGAVAIPSLSLLFEGGEAFVFRQSGEGAERVIVRVLSSSGIDALVSGELKSGDSVAADAVHFAAATAEDAHD